MGGRPPYKPKPSKEKIKAGASDAYNNSWTARGNYYEKYGKKAWNGVLYLPGQIVPKDNRKPTEDVKPATPSIFAEGYFLSSPDYAIEELLSLKALTGNEILQVAHRENFYTTSAVLNSNILDIVDSMNLYSPTEIIKLQRPDLSYFQNGLGSYSVSLTSSIVTINIPSVGIDQSFKVEVETFAPKSIKNDTIYT